jgi:hypothetical protein
MSLIGSSYGLDLGQQIPELAIFYLDAVIEIEGDAPVCIVPQEIVEDCQFDLLLFEAKTQIREQPFPGPGGSSSGTCGRFRPGPA